MHSIPREITAARNDCWANAVDVDQGRPCCLSRDYVDGGRSEFSTMQCFRGIETRTYVLVSAFDYTKVLKWRISMLAFFLQERYQGLGEHTSIFFELCY